MVLKADANCIIAFLFVSTALLCFF